MTELTDALIEAMAKAAAEDISIKLSWEEMDASTKYEWRQDMTVALAALSRVLAERGLKVTGREATEGMTADLCLDWYAGQWWERMHDAAPNLLEPKP